MFKCGEIEGREGIADCKTDRKLARPATRLTAPQ